MKTNSKYAWDSLMGEWIKFDKSQAEESYKLNVTYSKYGIPMIDHRIIERDEVADYISYKIGFPRPDWETFPDQEYLKRLKQTYNSDKASMADDGFMDAMTEGESIEFEQEDFTEDDPCTPGNIQQQVENFEFIGNIVPTDWFYFFRTGKGNKDRPYYEAITVLSEIIYWHRPKPDGTKRYEGKYLQKSYGQIAEKFRMTKSAAKAAFDYLEDVGIIKKRFENFVSKNGLHLSNVLCIDLCIDGLYRFNEKIIQHY